MGMAISYMSSPSRGGCDSRLAQPIGFRGWDGSMLIGVLVCSARAFSPSSSLPALSPSPGPGPRARTSAASVSSYSQAQLMPVDPRSPSARSRTGCYYVRLAPARQPPGCGWSSGGLGARDRTSGASRTSSNTCSSKARHFEEQVVNSSVDGPGIRADANAATSYGDTQYATRADRRARALDQRCSSRGLGQRRHLRREAVGRQRIVLRMAHEPRRRDARRRKIRRVQLEARYAGARRS